ncbi:hypothetical protein FH972_021794 [Carpinus fangiana]|uniref:Uncharacterized protein n=1 Tax=Carpinus fangiana TaxID=176857 RepID=A0A5N6KQQ2_9ROSI|nr:hypothetical protein FH972_021794 [Carpinus fangiana]
MVVVDRHEYLCKEEQRLKEDKERTKYWKKWGPYTAERQWATGQLPAAIDSKYLLADLTARSP